MKQTTHTSNSRDWSIVPYDGRSPFKKVRIRDAVNIRRIVTHLQAQHYVVLLGPPYSEKTALLRDVVAELRTIGVTQPIYINLWQARTEHELHFSPAWRI